MAKCCVRGCSNKLEAGSKIRMFRFPALLDKPKSLVELSRQRRNAWLNALNRTNLPEEILKSIGICSEHFVSGSPSRLKDSSEVDWIPTVKMGSQHRNRIEKKTMSPPQATKLKRISSVEKLSELEKLKNELKCKDAIIKNYKDESLQLKHQQRKIVINYEERLKEKDVKIKMNIRDQEPQSKNFNEPHRSETYKKGRNVTMRTGRSVQKVAFKQKLIKPCVVRIRRLLKIKDEPEDAEINKSQPAFKRNTSSKHDSFSVRDRSIKGTSSRDSTPVNTKPKGPVNKRLSDSPKPSFAKPEETPTRKTVLNKEENPSVTKSVSGKFEEEPLLTKARPKKADEALASKPIAKKVEEQRNTPRPVLKKVVSPTPPPKPTSKKIEESRTPKPSSKKVDEPLWLKTAIKEAEEVRTPKTGSRNSGELATPASSSRRVAAEPILAMASTRTRRAPKPNPKYANDDIITPKFKNKREKEILVLNEAGLDSDSGEDFYYGIGASSETETNDDNGDAFEVNDSSDFTDSEDFLLKRKRSPKSAPLASRSNASLAKRNCPTQKVTQVRPRPTAPFPVAVKSVEQKKIVQVPQRTPPTIPQPMILNRKRKLEDSSAKEPPESIIARNKRLNIALYDANLARPSSPSRSSTPKQPKQTVLTPKVQTTQASSILPQKRPMPGPLSSKTANLSAPKELQKLKNESPLQLRKSPSLIESSPELNDSANTQDDFECMPTFTIVNINDIINKKGDCLVQKRPEEDKPEKSSPNSLSRNSRRKAGHTTILSEKIDTVNVLKPVPRNPFPQTKNPTPQPKNPTPHSNITMQSKPQQRASLPTSTSTPTPPERKEVKKSLPEEKPSPPVDKPAPRILNSVVGKKTYPVQPILSKLDDDLEQEPIEDAVDKSVMVKENVGANKLIPTKPAHPRKLPAEKVFVQRQGNKLIKKITCFETWYVINIPETQEPIVKNCLDIPLITLSNAVKSVKLPSSFWSSKVTLYKLSAQMMNKSNLTPYTGDISDQSIREEDRENYQPSCVMFRRMTQQKSKTRMPYDRAVIFKMKTFFTNIDGKNVRLVGAPSKISSFKDIEVLLELVDELDLFHEFVETASTV